MSDCKPVKTPVDPGNHLVKATEDEEPVDCELYQSLVGSLMYLATCTRPDIAFAVGAVARFTSRPNQSHWVAAKRVLRYLKGTVSHGIIFRGSEPGSCVGYSDADWAGDREDRKSTSGYQWDLPPFWKTTSHRTRNPQFHGRAKHIDIKHHFVSE